MKEIAQKSNTYDYAVVFTEENLIQTLNNPLIHNEELWMSRIKSQWGDLIDFYHYLNEEDLIYGVLLKLTEGEEKRLLIKALESKKKGKIVEGNQTLDQTLKEANDIRIKEFIEKEKIDCEILLGAWDNVTAKMKSKLEI